MYHTNLYPIRKFEQKIEFTAETLDQLRQDVYAWLVENKTSACIDGEEEPITLGERFDQDEMVIGWHVSDPDDIICHEFELSEYDKAADVLSHLAVSFRYAAWSECSDCEVVMLYENDDGLCSACARKEEMAKL